MGKRLKTLAMIAVFGFGAAGGATLAKAPAAPARPAARDWNQVVTLLPGGSHLLGNPEAKTRLTQFVSYTCPHCAHFEEQADAQLRLGFVANGKGAVEVRNFVRDPIDLTVAMLTNCGPASKFFGNHTMFMRSQAKWIGPLAAPSPSQRERWGTGTFPQRTKYIAQDFGFYPMMESRGYTVTQIEACLADEAAARRIAAMTDQDQKTFGIPGTPSFAINGQLVADTFGWDALRPKLAEAQKAN